jgi:hypothetical protein
MISYSFASPPGYPVDLEIMLSGQAQISFSETESTRELLRRKACNCSHTIVCPVMKVWMKLATSVTVKLTMCWFGSSPFVSVSFSLSLPLVSISGCYAVS